MPPTTLAVKKEISVASLTSNLVSKDIHIAATFGISEITRGLNNAKTAIDHKYMEIGGDTGAPVAGVEFGAGDGYRRRYKNGVIYYLPPAGPCWVHGAILGKYLSLGADGGFLGYPTTDELTTPDGFGRYNHFERGSIYWTYGTGAHEVHGAIRDRWASLGWERSWLGYPTSDERPFTEGGRVSEFEHGAIYWWPDTGAIDLGHVVLRYKGLYCFGETRGGGADEPYVVLGVVPVPPGEGVDVRTQIYDDVDSGNARPDMLELYRGIPGGLALGVALFEHDEGDPDKYLGLVRKGVELAGKGISKGCGALLGQEAVPVCDGIWSAIAPEIVNGVNGLLGTGDDLIGKSAWHLTARQMVTQVGAAGQHFWGIDYNRESELLSDGDASYKVYFSLERA